MTKYLATVTRSQSYPTFRPAGRSFAWYWTYSVTLPGHWETDAKGARFLAEGGTHSVGASRLDEVKTICRRAGATPVYAWQ